MKYTIVLLASLSIILTSCGSSRGVKNEINPFDIKFDRAGHFLKSESQIYTLANMWAVKRFNSAEAVIEYQDKEAGVMMGKYISTVGLNKYKILVTVKIKGSDCQISFQIVDIISVRSKEGIFGGFVKAHENELMEYWHFLSEDFFDYIKSDYWID